MTWAQDDLYLPGRGANCHQQGDLAQSVDDSIVKSCGHEYELSRNR